MKRAAKVAGLAMAAVALIGAAFVLRMSMMSSRVESAYREVSRVNLSEIADGAYRGEFGDFLVAVQLEVVVREGRIQAIEVLHQESGSGYEARETIDRILAAQTARVKTVSGATGSSKAIMAAVYRALSTSGRLK